MVKRVENRCIRVEIVPGRGEVSIGEMLDSFLQDCVGGDVGAIAVFIGVVKEVVGSSRVLKLNYSAIEEVAVEKLKAIASEISSSHNLRGILIRHYIGSLKPGDPTLVVFVAGESRKNVYPALEEAVERIKHEVPIFKLEERNDGAFWVVGDGMRIPRKS